jgi:hypothetical protein
MRASDLRATAAQPSLADQWQSCTPASSRTAADSAVLAAFTADLPALSTLQPSFREVLMKTITGCALLGLAVACLAIRIMNLRKPTERWTRREFRIEAAMPTVGLLALFAGCGLLGINAGQ